MSEKSEVSKRHIAMVEELFRENPDRFSSVAKEKILAQRICSGMTPYEAHLAGGAFVFKVKPDPEKWKINADPYQVMWAQELHPDKSQIWMTFQNESQFPGEMVRFKAEFESGRVVRVINLLNKE